jgi:hypothetical protein
MTRFSGLKAQYKFVEAVLDVKNPVPAGEVVRVPLRLNWLPKAVASIESEFGLFGFVNSDGRQDDPDYASISLTYNPQSPGNPHTATLGCPHVSQEQHFYGEGVNQHVVLRDSYYDTYGFSMPTPAAQKHLAPLFNQMKRSPVRARLSVIRTGRTGPEGFFWGWHKDEPVFENLRVNIHVQDSDAHRIQIMRANRMPVGPADSAMVTHRFSAGYGYSWDTNMPHRACTIGPATSDRAAIVLGFSPWFDYDAATDEWAPNEFFGKKHPLQMLLDGDVL